MHLWFDDVGSECMPTFSAFITSVGDVGNSSWLAAVWPSSISSLLCMPWRQKNHWRRRACWLRSYKRHTRFFYVLFLFASLLIRNSLNWSTLRAVVTNVFPYLPRHVTQLASTIVSLVLASAFWLSAAWPDSSSCTCRHISSINCKKHLRTCGMNSFLKRTHSSDSSGLMLILQLAKNNNE